MSNVKVKKIDNYAYELGIKRFYVPYSITQYCKTCEENKEFDLTDYPLYDPTIQEDFKYEFTCQDCYEEMDPIILRIDIRVSVKEFGEDDK